MHTLVRRVRGLRKASGRELCKDGVKTMIVLSSKIMKCSASSNKFVVLTTRWHWQPSATHR